MIAPQILLISAFLSITWGIYLFATAKGYIALRNASPIRRRGDTVQAMRRFLVALCLWTICFSYVFRTGCVLIGLGEATAGQIAFFAILGINIPASIFAVVSLRFD
jgi:hypothetical protein